MFNVINKTRSEFIICLFLVVTILAAYWQLPIHDFLVFDDNKYITQNTHVHEGITWKNIAWAFSNTDFGYWPVMKMRNIGMAKKQSNWLKCYVKLPGVINHWHWMLLLQLMQRQKDLMRRF